MNAASFDESEVSAYETADDSEDVCPEIEHDGDERAELYDGNEGGPLFRAFDLTHEFSCKREVSCRTDWNEFCESLNETEDYRFDN